MVLLKHKALFNLICLDQWLCIELTKQGGGFESRLAHGCLSIG